MKNSELILLDNNIKKKENEFNNLVGAKFALVFLKNIKILKDEIQILNSILKYSDEYILFDKDRIELCKKYANKDANNNPIIIDNHYDVNIKNEEYIREFEELKLKHKQAIENRNRQISSYNELLNTDSKIEFIKIDEDIIPNDISIELLSIIQPMINN